MWRFPQHGPVRDEIKSLENQLPESLGHLLLFSTRSDTHALSCRHTHAPSSVAHRGPVNVCTRFLSLLSNLKAGNLTRFQREASHQSELSCPLSLQQKRTPQLSPAIPTPRPPPPRLASERNPLLSDQKEKDSQRGQQIRLTLPTVCVSNVPSQNCLFSQTDSCALAQVGQIPSEPPD